jgi:predicted dienelactone hydrolase
MRLSYRPYRIVIGAVSGALLLAACSGVSGQGPVATQSTRAGDATSSAGPSGPSVHPARPAWTARPAVGKLGTYRVGRYVMDLSYRPRGESERRRLRVFVRYPAVAGTAVAAAARARAGLFPLVVFAPGYRQCVDGYGTLLHEWASAGYVVAAVQFPRTNCHVLAPDEADLSSQPADLSYVIGRLLAASRQTGNRMTGLIDPAKIAVAGHSDGGDTVAAVVANTCCRDRRVSAAVVLAGAEWPPLPGKYFTTRTVPMLFVQGIADTWNPPDASLQLYLADVRGRRYYLALRGAGHFSPYEGGGPPEPIVARVTLDFLDRYLVGQAGAIGAMRTAGQVPGVAQLVSGGRLPES